MDKILCDDVAKLIYQYLEPGMLGKFVVSLLPSFLSLPGLQLIL
jgi:hypothetical protein